VRAAARAEKFLGDSWTWNAALCGGCRRTGETAWLEAAEAAVRERLVSAERSLLEAVSTPASWNPSTTAIASASGHAPAPHPRAAPRCCGALRGAGRRAREAGFDGIELHYAHATRWRRSSRG